MINRQLKFFEAIREAIDICLERDRNTYLMGLGVPDPIGVFGTTKGLQDKHGKKRVFDMPVAESAMSGVALGSCLVGMRPIMTHMRLEFAMTAMDQICNQAAKWHYMFGGQSKVPLTIRMLVGRGWGQGPQHSQSLHAWFAHIPGLKVVMPATPADAKGLLKAAIRDDNPVVFIEGEMLYNNKGEVPEGEYLTPLGTADIKRAGTDVTIVSHGKTVAVALKAAEQLAAEGVNAEVIDLRTIRPLDTATILGSVSRTNRCVVVEEGWQFAGVGAQVVDLIQREIFDALDAPVLRVTGADVPMPYNKHLEKAAKADPAKVIAAAKQVLYLP